MTVVDLYTIQIIDDTFFGPEIDLAKVPTLMAETEENLTDLLPRGYRARIRRWDHPDSTQEDNDE